MHPKEPVKIIDDFNQFCELDMLGTDQGLAFDLFVSSRRNWDMKHTMLGGNLGITLLPSNGRATQPLLLMLLRRATF